MIRDAKQVNVYIDERPMIEPERRVAVPVMAYTLDKRIPIFLIDFPIGEWRIVRLDPEGYQIISLDSERKLTKDVSLKKLIEETPLSRCTVRNQFWADSINYLFMNNFDRVALVSGWAHFDPNDKEQERPVQDYINADKKELVDLRIEDKLL